MHPSDRARLEENVLKNLARTPSFEQLRKIELFADLTDKHLEVISELADEASLPPEQVIFRPGDKPRSFYVLLDGQVRISELFADDREECLSILKDGTYFGEIKLLDASKPYPVLAITHTECRLLVFPLVEFCNLLNIDQDLAVAVLWNIARTLANKLEATNQKVAAMARLAYPI